MIRPDDMLPSDWQAFVAYMLSRGTNVNNEHPDDVTPWLEVWRAALVWERG